MKTSGSLTRQGFKWSSQSGGSYRLSQIDDLYLANMIRYLERGEGETALDREDTIEFLREEQERRFDSTGRRYFGE